MQTNASIDTLPQRRAAGSHTARDRAASRKRLARRRRLGAVLLACLWMAAGSVSAQQPAAEQRPGGRALATAPVLGQNPLRESPPLFVLGRWLAPPLRDAATVPSTDDPAGLPDSLADSAAPVDPITSEFWDGSIAPAGYWTVVDPPTASPLANSLRPAAVPDSAIAEAPAPVVVAPVAAAAASVINTSPDKPDGALDREFDVARVQEFASSIATAIEQTKADTQLADDARTQRLQVLSAAAQAVQEALANYQRASDYRAETEQAPAETSRLESLLSRPPPAVPAPPTDRPIEELTQLAQAASLEVEALRSSLETAKQAIEQRAARLPLLETQRSEMATLIDALRGQVASLRSAEGTATFDRWQLMAVEAQLMAATTRYQLLTVERQRQDAVAALLPLRQRAAQQALERSTTRHDALAQALADQRLRQTERDADMARRDAAQAHPVLAPLAERIAALAEQSNELAGELQSTIDELERIKAQTTASSDCRQQLEEKVKLAGRTATVGMLLRKSRNELPPLATPHQRLREIERQLPDVQLQKMAFEEERDRLAAELAFVETAIDGLDLANDRCTAAGLKSAAAAFIERKRQVLDSLIASYDQYVTNLSAVDSGWRELIDEVRSLRLFIDEHVLWPRSTDPLTVNDIAAAVQATVAVMTATHWQAVGENMLRQARTRPYLFVLAFLGVVALALIRGQFLRRLKLVNLQAEVDNVGVHALVRSLLYTLAAAALWPSVVLGLAWLLRSPYDSESLPGAIGAALVPLGWHLIWVGILIQLVRRRGLAECFLDWRPETALAMRRALRLIAWLVLPLLLAAEVFEVFEKGRWHGSLGRLLFMAAMGVLLASLWTGLRGALGSWRAAASDRSPPLFVQLAWLWMFPLLVAPLVLGGLAAAGYYFSALQLTQCALATIWVTLALCVVNSFLVRSSHSAFRLIHNRRQMQRAQTVTRTDTNDSSVQEQEHEREDADIANMSQQMGRLLKLATIAAGIGLAWMIWDQVLPATAALNRVELWHYTAEVPQPSAADATRTELVKEARSITLGHALMMMAIALVTIAVSRNLPGLLEVVLLNRLPLDRGGKYAISIVCRYFVVIVGMLLAFRAIGITWHSVQWLAAAVTVGLGFGLQEIFANFVSGLIILLERPVRLGDLVTVNNTTGVVTRIQLRATTITDADRKEMVVPNKRFITDEVVNWSLTDPTIRVVVNIGVAHGADIQLVQRTLIQVARRHPLVLKEPAPSAVFRRFAENSLDFELRVFVPSFENSTEVLHQLNTAIDIAFRQAQIELASPKNDWHLRSVDGATLAAFTRGSVPHAPPGGSPAATDTKAA